MSIETRWTVRDPCVPRHAATAVLLAASIASIAVASGTEGSQEPGEAASEPVRCRTPAPIGRRRPSSHAPRRSSAT